MHGTRLNCSHTDRATELSADALPVLNEHVLNEQKNILFLLKSALERSNLLVEFSDFRQQYIAYAKTQTQPQQSQRTDSMLRLKAASESFIYSIQPLASSEKNILRDLGWADLVCQRAWLQILLAEPQSISRISTLNSVYKKLLLIDTHQSDKGRLIRTTAPCEEKTTLDAPPQRKSSATGFVSGFLTLGLALLFCLSQAPEAAEILLTWSRENSTIYKTIVVLVLLTLAVFAFQSITHILTPLKPAAVLSNVHKKESYSSRRIFQLKASPRRVIAGCAGPLLLGFGTGVSATAGFGAFGVTVMLDGINHTYDTPFWVSQLVLTIACYLLAWHWARIPLGLGTPPALLLIGPAISAGATVGQQDLTFVGNSLAFGIGTLVFAFGIALTAAAALGPDGKTALSLAAEKKNHWPIPRSAFYFNMVSIGIGITLGGNFGVATVLNLLAMPVLLHYFIPPLRRYLQHKWTA